MILTYYTATTMIIIAYLLGSIPSAVWIGKKYYGIDIREHGSKNRIRARFPEGVRGGDDHRPDEIRQRIRRRGQ